MSLCLALLLLSVGASSATGQVGRYDGDIQVAAFFPIHDRIESGVTNKKDTVCGQLKKEDSIQLLEALYFALDRVNNDSSILPGVRLGASVLDTCNDESHALEEGVALLRFLMMQGDTRIPYRCGDGSTPEVIPGYQVFHKIVGVLGAARSAITMHLAALLQLFSLPQVSYLSTSSELSQKDRYPYFVRTVPSDTNQAKAIVEVLKEFNWTYVSVVYDDSFYGSKGFSDLSRVAEEEGVCFAYSVDIDFDNPNWDEKEYNKIANDLMRMTSTNVVVVFTQRTQARRLFEAVYALRDREGFRPLVFVGSDAWSGRYSVTEGLEDILDGTISVQPLAVRLPDFDAYFTNLSPYSNGRNPWFQEFWEAHFNCSFRPVITPRPGLFSPAINVTQTPITDIPSVNPAHGAAPGEDSQGQGKVKVKSCTGHEILSAATGYEQQLNLHFVHDAVLVYAHALHAMQQDLCGVGHSGLCPAFSPLNLTGEMIMDYLQDINFTSVTGLPFNFYNQTDGPPRYSIMTYSKEEHGWHAVGNYSDVDGEKEFRFDSNFRARIPSYPSSQCSLPCGPGQIRKAIVGDNCCWLCNNCSEWAVVVDVSANEQTCSECLPGFRPDAARTKCEAIPVVYITHDNPWSVGIQSVAIVGIILTSTVLSIFLRFFGTPVIKASGRELSLILLIGIFMSFGTVFAIMAPPNPPVCGIARVMLGLSYAVIYASILTKTNRIARIFTESSASPSKTRFTSPRSQLIIVGVLVFGQCVIVAVWMAADKPEAIHVYPTRDTNVLVCKGEQNVSILVPLIYPFLLLLLCAVYAFKTRKTPDGFNETRFIGFTSYTTFVIWLAFTPLYFIVSHYAVKNFVLSLALSLTALVSLACLFVPKIYVCLCRPQKNTREAVMARTCSVNSASFILEPGGSNAAGTGNPAHHSSNDISCKNTASRQHIHSYHPGISSKPDPSEYRSASGNHLHLPRHSPKAEVKRATSLRTMPTTRTEEAPSTTSLRDITLRLQSPLHFNSPAGDNGQLKRTGSLPRPDNPEESQRSRSSSWVTRKQRTEPEQKKSGSSDSDA